MKAVILFFVVLAIAALIAGTLWARSLTAWKNALKEKEQYLDYLQRSYNTNIAELHAKQESLRKQESKIQSEKQDIADQLNALLVKHQEFNEKEKALEKWEAELVNKKADGTFDENVATAVDTKIIDESLDKMAEKYEKNHTYLRYDGYGLTPKYCGTLAESFIAGAKWGAEHLKKQKHENNDI